MKESVLSLGEMVDTGIESEGWRVLLKVKSRRFETRRVEPSG
jgi:hypothetical protein